MLRDMFINHCVRELDKEIIDLLDLREELTGERIVFEEESLILKKSNIDVQSAMERFKKGV